MRTTGAIFYGEHRGRPATVTFEHEPGRVWKVTMVVHGKVVTVECSDRSVKPCMTHAGYLLNKHFPAALKPPRKVSAHEATVVESSFIQQKTGCRLRVVK